MTGPTQVWIPIGFVVRAHGVRGEFRVRLELDESLTLLAKGLRLQADLRDGSRRTLTVERVRPIHGAVLLTIDELREREAVQTLAGARLSVLSEDVPKDDAPYLFEFEGANAVDESGTVVGVVRRVADNGGQDLLIMDGPTGERMLPLVDETFVAFDRETNTLVVRPIPGLWDDAL